MHYQKAFSLDLLLDTLEPHHHRTHTHYCQLFVCARVRACVSKKQPHRQTHISQVLLKGTRWDVYKITGLLLRSAYRLFMKHRAIVLVMKDAWRKADTLHRNEHFICSFLRRSFQRWKRHAQAVHAVKGTRHRRRSCTFPSHCSSFLPDVWN